MGEDFETMSSSVLGFFLGACSCDIGDASRFPGTRPRIGTADGGGIESLGGGGATNSCSLALDFGGGGTNGGGMGCLGRRSVSCSGPSQPKVGFKMDDSYKKGINEQAKEKKNTFMLAKMSP